MGLLDASFFFIIALALLSGSSLFLVKHLSLFSRKIGLSGFIVGSVILAVGTSLPELLDALIANLQNLGGMGIGVIIGSSITNLCLILSITSLISKKSTRTHKFEKKMIIFSVLPLIMFLIFGMNNTISRFEGIALFALFVIYQLLNYGQGLKESKRKLTLKKDWHHFFIIPAAIFVLIMAAILVIDSGQSLAVIAGIPTAVIGLIMISFGTSVPELASSVVATIKKEGGLVLGNIIGSNITNVFMVIGLVSLIKPIKFDFDIFAFPLILAIISTLYFIVYIDINKKIDRPLGLSLLAIYAIYLIGVMLNL